MKTTGILGTATLALLLVIAAPAYAWQGQQGEKQDHQEQQKQDKHAQAPKQEHAQPRGHPTPQQAGRPDRIKPPQPAEQDKHSQPQQAQREHQAQPQHSQQQQHVQAQPVHQQPSHTTNQQHVQQTAWQQHRASNWQSDHRTWQQRGGYHGYRIPDDRYRGYFGPQHGFRIQGLPFLVVGGYPRFQYDGYWVSPVDPWPESWANNWYSTDDVYINYVDNGYYLYNRRYPTMGIAVNISM